MFGDIRKGALGVPQRLNSIEPLGPERVLRLKALFQSALSMADGLFCEGTVLCCGDRCYERTRLSPRIQIHALSAWSGQKKIDHGLELYSPKTSYICTY